MAKDTMTIRLAPDGFSFVKCPGTDSILLDDAPFHEVAPGQNFQMRLQEQILTAVTPEGDTLTDLVCQVVSTRVIILPPTAADASRATQYYHTTLGKIDEDERVVIQPLTLPSGEDIILCFGINRSLYNFLMRNYGDVTFEHHLATLLVQGARLAHGNCLIVRCDPQFLELALFRNRRLHLATVYQTTQPDNRTYYVMNTWKQESLDQLQDSLLVLGKCNEALQVRASLHRYIKHVFA